MEIGWIENINKHINEEDNKETPDPNLTQISFLC